MLATALLLAHSYFWLEAERFAGVTAHYPSFSEEKPAPGWHWNGPGVSAEWGQGGESGFNSISCGSAADGGSAARVQVAVPRAGRWRLWVRYGEWLDAPSPITVRLGQGARRSTLRVGERATLDRQDESLAYWGWTFVWDGAEVELARGALEVTLACDRAGKARRIVDVVLLTDDTAWRPSGRTRPPFAYLDALAAWRKEASRIPPAQDRAPPSAWKPAPPLEVPWNFTAQSFEPGLPLFSVEPALRSSFVAAFRNQRVPIFSSPLIVPVLKLDELPELLPGRPMRTFLDRSKKPFYVLQNYQPAPWRNDAAKRGPVAQARAALAAQDRGDLSGENIGYPYDLDEKQLASALDEAPTRAAALGEIHRAYDAALRRKRSALYGAADSPWSSMVVALSTGLPAYAHALAGWGIRAVGLETAAGMPAFAAWLAFARGAARQLGRDLFYYHAPNFGDTATTFTTVQNFAGPGAWYHTRYGLVFGPSIAWYRKSLLLEWLGGARAIYLEQGNDQFFQPGPGPHPVQLNPLGRVTQEFLALAERHASDRGTPVCTTALLLDPAHGWSSQVTYVPRAFGLDTRNPALAWSDADQSIEQALDVLFYPNAAVQGEPATAERQAFVHATLGDNVDVRVAREDLELGDCQVLVPAGRVSVPAPLASRIEARLARGELRLVLARGSAPALEPLCGRPGVRCVEDPLGLGEDGAASPEWARAIAEAVWAAAPVHVIGDIEWMVSRNRRGYVVGLFNSRGNYKPQQGLQIAPRRDEIAEVEVVTARPPRQAREWLTARSVPIVDGRMRLSVPAGAVRILELTVR